MTLPTISRGFRSDFVETLVRGNSAGRTECDTRRGRSGPSPVGLGASARRALLFELFVPPRETRPTRAGDDVAAYEDAALADFVIRAIWFDAPRRELRARSAGARIAERYPEMIDPHENDTPSPGRDLVASGTWEAPVQGGMA